MVTKKDFKKQPKLNKGWIPLISIIAIIIILGFGTAAKKSQVEEAKKAGLKEGPPAINVVTMTMKKGTIRDRINLPGVIEPWVKLQVPAEVAGVIEVKKLTKGAYVKRGETIAVIESSKYLNAYNAAKASHESAVASKKRLTNLYSSKLSNKSELDRVTAEAANYEAEMRVAKLDLEKCNIKSPISGIVNQIHIEKGQFVDTGNTIAEVLQIDKVKVNVGIPESDVSAVSSINEFEVRIDALDGKVFNATKHYMSKTTSSLARMYDLELKLQNTSGEILPDMFVRVEIVKKEVPDAISIPLYSIIPLGDKNYVYVTKAGTAYRKEVKTGLQEGWMQEITEGINEGDNVIVIGQRSVSDTQKVNVIRTVTEVEELTR